MTASNNSVRRMDFTISLRPNMEDFAEKGIYPEDFIDTSYHPIERSVEFLEQFLENKVDQYVFQVEDSKDFITKQGDLLTRNVHIQGRLNIKRRMRTTAMVAEMSRWFNNKLWNMIKLEHIRISPTANPTKNFDYCMKDKTRIMGPFSDREIEAYKVEDPLLNKTLFKYQDIIMNQWLTKEGKLLYNNNGRRILFVQDETGNSGKSTMVKHLAISRQKDVLVLPVCGTPNQLSSALIDAGPYPYYILDLPRVKPNDTNWISDILFIIEQLQNGLLCNTMYGKYKSLVMSNPQIVVMSNWIIPRDLSLDRYVLIDPKTCQGDELDKVLLPKGETTGSVGLTEFFEKKKEEQDDFRGPD